VSTRRLLLFLAVSMILSMAVGLGVAIMVTATTHAVPNPPHVIEP